MMKQISTWLMLAAAAMALCGCPDEKTGPAEATSMTVTRWVPFYDFTEERGYEIASTADTIEQFDLAGRLVSKKAHGAGADKIAIEKNAATWRLTTDCYGWAHSDVGKRNKLRVCRAEFRRLPAQSYDWQLTADDIVNIIDF